MAVEHGEYYEELGLSIMVPSKWTWLVLCYGEQNPFSSSTYGQVNYYQKSGNHLENNWALR